MMMNMSEIDNWKVVQKKQIVDDQIGGDLRRQGSKQYRTTKCTIPYRECVQYHTTMCVQYHTTMCVQYHTKNVYNTTQSTL